MSLSPDTTPIPSIEALHRPVPPSQRCIEEKTDADNFHNLLDAPIIGAENTLTTKPTVEEIEETATDASAWLVLNTAGFMPLAEPKPENAPFSAEQTLVSTVEQEGRQHVLATNEALLSSPLIQSEITSLLNMPEASHKPVSAVFNADIAEILVSNSNAMPVVLSAASLPLFSPIHFVATDPPLPIPDLQHPNFEQGIATHLRWLADHSIGQAHIRVSPPHLGAIDIQLHLCDQQLHATFSSVHTEVCQRLQESLPMLHQLLDEHGLHLAQADVNQQAPHSDAHTHTEKTAELSVVKENTTEKKSSLNPQSYRQTTLLDIWA